jgi:glycerol-3-phosphate acyltransferase PlsY
MKYLITLTISYLLGSINTAYLFGKAHGVDIRDKGSRNAGASNIKVNYGWAAGIFTGLCDMAKAIVAMKLCAHLFPGDELIPFLAGGMTIVGHIFPFYMQFKGGKGFASYLGMMIGIDLKLGLIIVALTIVLSLLSNYVVVGTLIVLIIVPLYFIYIKADISIIMIMIAISALIAYKHRINIRRLIAHEEMGVFDRKKHK